MSVAVLLSLLEALTLAPMRCSQYLQIESTSFISKKMDQAMNSTRQLYTKFLGQALHHRWKVIIAALSLFFISLFLGHFVKSEFVPSQDQGRLLVRLQTPLGSSIETTDDVTKKAEALVAKMSSIAQYYVAVGGFGAGGEVNTAMMFLTLKNRKDRPRTSKWRWWPHWGGHHETQQEVMDLLRNQLNQIPGVTRASIQDLSLAGFSSQRGGGFPVEFTIRGPDWDKLGSLSAVMMEKMKASGLMEDVDTDYQLGMPEIRVIPDREKAAARGVSISNIGNTINAAIGGVRAGKYTKNGKRYDVRVRLLDQNRRAPEDIDKIWVRNNHGELVQLHEVVSLTQTPTLLSISRRDRERAIGIFANVTHGKSQTEALNTVNKIASEILPEGYRLILSGSAQTFKESSQSLFFALILGIFVAYMVLASQFNSFIHPLTVLLALPFSLTGAFIALLLGHQSLNIYSMIGMILLMGIVKKNSILLVDFTNENRKKGVPVYEALMKACPIRLRPILMTSFATIAGALAPALGVGPGAETRVPMALVVIGGVLVSTFLTLFVVPCAYSLLARFESRRHDHDLKKALVELGELPS